MNDHNIRPLNPVPGYSLWRSRTKFTSGFMFNDGGYVYRVFEDTHINVLYVETLDLDRWFRYHLIQDFVWNEFASWDPPKRFIELLLIMRDRALELGYVQGS